jgi:hypothetical protein
MIVNMVGAGQKPMIQPKGMIKISAIATPPNTIKSQSSVFASVNRCAALGSYF